MSGRVSEAASFSLSDYLNLPVQSNDNRAVVSNARTDDTQKAPPTFTLSSLNRETVDSPSTRETPLRLSGILGRSTLSGVGGTISNEGRVNDDTLLRKLRSSELSVERVNRLLIDERKSSNSRQTQLSTELKFAQTSLRATRDQLASAVEKISAVSSVSREQRVRYEHCLQTSQNEQDNLTCRMNSILDENKTLHTEVASTYEKSKDTERRLNECQSKLIDLQSSKCELEEELERVNATLSGIRKQPTTQQTQVDETQKVLEERLKAELHTLSMPLSDTSKLMLDQYEAKLALFKLSTGQAKDFVKREAQDLYDQILGGSVNRTYLNTNTTCLNGTTPNQVHFPNNSKVNKIHLFTRDNTGVCIGAQRICKDDISDKAHGKGSTEHPESTGNGCATDDTYNTQGELDTAQMRMNAAVKCIKSDIARALQSSLDAFQIASQSPIDDGAYR